MEREMIEMIRGVGSKLTQKQISKIGEEAERKFGVDKDALMLLLLSGSKEFKDFVYEIAERKAE